MRSTLKILSIICSTLVLGIIGLQVFAASSQMTDMTLATRFPASIGLGMSSLDEEPHLVSDIEVIEIPCDSNSVRLEVEKQVTMVRLSGKWCTAGAKLKLDSSMIQNQSTGMFATLFNLPEQKFSSDLIALVPGPNSVMVTAQDLSGHTHLYQLEINKK